MMILVTGASGFVGSAVLKHFDDRGFEVVGMVRSSSDLKRLSEKKMQLRYADLSSFPHLVKAMEGSKVVIHCAARSLDWGRRKDFLQTNVLGVENLMRAAAAVKSVKKVLYISTANVAGFGKRNMSEMNGRESRPVFTYSQTKLQGERIVREMCREEGIECRILRPSAVYGPEDWKWSYRMIDRIAKSYWPLIDGGKAVFTPVFIENLCRAIELAVERGNTDRVLNITDDVTISWRSFGEKIARCLGVSPNFKTIPSPLALCLSALIGSTQRVFMPTTEPNITLYRVLRSSRDFHYSCDRAKKLLSYTPDSNIDSHLQKTVDWYRTVAENQVSSQKSGNGFAGKEL
jgi:nucleoside-diphosphate-sugar epimerase